MEQTRNKNLIPDFFTEKAKELFKRVNTPIFDDKKKAEEDSISYYFELNKKIIQGELKI